MGNDSGIRKKSKQRTPPHKKHTVYPSMILSNEVKIEYGSIRPINPVVYNIPQSPKKSTDYNDPMWSAYDQAAKMLDKGSNSSAAVSNGLERRYGRAYRLLAREGKVMKIKRKYSHN